MKLRQNSKQIISGLTFGLLVFTGTYNAVVINSESSISSNVRISKRIEEVYGSLESKREVAAAISWQKISMKQAAQVRVAKVENKQQQQTAEVVSTSSPAAITDSLDLQLSSVINPGVWDKGVQPSEVSGSLQASNGVIESLSISLPSGKNLPDGAKIDVAFSELEGNSFVYDYDGQPQSGIFFQRDQKTYEVNLVGGPLGGTNLSFKAQPTHEEEMQQEEAARVVAENSEAQNYNNQPEIAYAPAQNEMNGFDQQQVEQAPVPEQAQAYNFEVNEAAM